MDISIESNDGLAVNNDLSYVPMPHYLYSCAVCFILILITACETYDFTVNEKVVYSPKPLFSDFDVADEALQQCLEQAVIDNNVSVASELSTLNCSHAGVTNLAGLETFTGISRLKLSSNRIQNISPIAALTILEVLQLDNNHVIDTTALLELPALSTLDLTGNQELLCPSDTNLLNVETLTLPGHCSR